MLDGFTDIGEQASGLFLVVLFAGLGFVNETGTLGDRHFGRCCGVYEDWLKGKFSGFDKSVTCKPGRNLDALAIANMS